MGKRATEELGYQVQYAQKEENVHIGRLCEVLERIFSHGLKFRKSHSALWNFLLEFKKYSPPEASSDIIENDQSDGYLTSMAKRLAGLDYKRDITPPARSPMADMNQITKMKSITTDIGRARAWIRLSIEKRLLSHHLRYIFELWFRVECLNLSHSRVRRLVNVCAKRAVKEIGRVTISELFSVFFSAIQEHAIAPRTEIVHFGK